MAWYHPNYYKRLKANRQQASGNGRVGPQVSSAKKNKSLDRSRNVGYCGITTAVVKEIEIAIPKAQQDTGDAPLMGPPNRAAEALQGDQHKYPGDGSSRTCSVMVKSKPRVSSSQADKQQAEGNGRVGPKGTGGQASGDSRINKR
jgi:hypothetical protein